MANIFIGIAQYKPMPEEKVMELARDLEMPWYRYTGNGLHPRVDVALMNTLEWPMHTFGWMRLMGDGQLDRARAWLLGSFLQGHESLGKFDYFLVLDEDIEWPCWALDWLIDTDEPLIGAAYGFKGERNPRKGQMVAKPLHGKYEPDENGLLEIMWLNGGFIFIRRDAIEKMIETFPDLRYNRDPAVWVGEGYKGDAATSYGFWQPFVYEFPDGYRMYLSEDYAFSERARMAGLKVMLHCKVHLTHWDGAVPFRLQPSKEEAA